MDPELKRMLVKQINVRSPSSYTAAGDQVLSAAVPMPAHVELVKSVGAESAGKESVVHHLVITELELRRDDFVWMPGDDPLDLNLRKAPTSVDVFFDPETGLVDHYETTI